MLILFAPVCFTQATVRELKNLACDTFGVDKEASKVIDFYQQRFHASLEDKYDSSLEEASLLDGQHIKIAPRDVSAHANAHVCVCYILLRSCAFVTHKKRSERAGSHSARHVCAHCG